MRTYRFILLLAFAWAFGLVGCGVQETAHTTQPNGTPADATAQVVTNTEDMSVAQTLDFTEENTSSTVVEVNAPYRKVAQKKMIQTFTIEGDEMNTVKGTNGTIVHVPRHCFQYQNGKAVNGTLQLHLVEADDLNEFVALGMTTRTDNNGILKTQAMYYLNATQKGVTLKIDVEKPVLVQLPKIIGAEKQERFFAVNDANGKAVWRTVSPHETAGWKITEQPVQPKIYQTAYSQPYCAYKCFDKVNEMIGETAVPLMEHLQQLAADTGRNGRTVHFTIESQITKAKPKVSRLEKETQKYVFVQDKLYSRDRKAVTEAEKLTGMRIMPTKLNGTVFLTAQEAMFYDLTPAIEPAENVVQFLDRYPYLKDNKLNFVTLENVAHTALEAIKNAPVYQTEEEVVKMIQTGGQADEKPTYFQINGETYANLKAVRLFAPTYNMKDEAVHAGKLTRAKFKSPAINARFVNYRHFTMMIQDLYADLHNGNVIRELPKNVAMNELATMSKNLLGYRQTATESDKQGIEFFKYKGRFYVSKQYLNPIIHTLAVRHGHQAPKMNAFDLMNQMATVYHRSDFKDPYLKFNYLDMTVAVTPNVHYAKANEKDEVYAAHESLDIIRKAANTDSLAEFHRHTEALNMNADKECLALIETGWVALAKEIKPKELNVYGKIAGIIPDNSVTLHVICPENKTYLTYQSSEGVFNFFCPKGETVKILARFGNNANIVTFNPKGNKLDAGEVTLLLRKEKDIEGLIATL